MPDTILRQWAMLRVIPRYPRKIETAAIEAELKKQNYEVTRRTIQRDLQELSAVFPLVCDDRSKPFGWSWGKDANLVELPGMDPQMAVTFKIIKEFTSPFLPPATLDHLKGHFKNGDNILRELHSNKFARWPQKVRVIAPWPPLMKPRINSDVLNIIYEGLLDEKRIAVHYRPRGVDKSREYEINPLGLVIHRSIYYLVGALWDYADVRHFAVHRISKAALTDTPASIPKGFNLDEHISQERFNYTYPEGKIKLKALFDPNVAEHLYETPLSMDQKLSKRKDGRVLLEATVVLSSQLIWWLQAFGDLVEVIEPISLRASFKEIATKLYNAYK